MNYMRGVSVNGRDKAKRRENLVLCDPVGDFTTAFEGNGTDDSVE
jgi:hypothetical protein